jgi:Rrf2 family protein
VSGPTNTQFAVAVHLLTLLASLPDVVQSSEEMAGSVGANPVHVRRVLGRLRTSGLVASRPGVHGGWRLVRDPDEVTLGEVWRVLQGDEPLLAIHDGANPECPVGREIQGTLTEIARRAAAAVEGELEQTTVGDALRATTRNVAGAA